MQQRGFSLVELSIVLVILGLLTGGILAGQSLIRAAEIRNVSVELDKYFTASRSFRDKYFAMPGDMTNATKFWQAQDPTPATCKVTPSSSALTCDGDGDGRILDTAAGSNEPFRYWQHLANAGLIEGTYTGVSDPPSPAGLGATLGTNVPRSKIGNAGYTIVYYNSPGMVMLYDRNNQYGNTIIFGTKNVFTDAPALTPEEAWNIDTKIDDGKAARGRLLPFNSLLNAGCTTGDTDSDDYALTSKTRSCALNLRQVF